MRYVIVTNPDRQHSIWPEPKELPAGWRRDEFTGTRQECLDRIAQVWTDLRPRPELEADHG